MDSPIAVARAIAARRTLAEREAGLAQVAPGFLVLVGELLAFSFADEIISLDDRESRTEALENVPARVRGRVRELVVMRFQVRQTLRAFEASREPGTVCQ